MLKQVLLPCPQICGLRAIIPWWSVVCLPPFMYSGGGILSDKAAKKPKNHKTTKSRAVMDAFHTLQTHLNDITAERPFGKVCGVSGLVISCEGLPGTAVGSRCAIRTLNNQLVNAEVVGYRNGLIMLMPFGLVEGIGPGCRVYNLSAQAVFRVNHSFMGRVINALGQPIDGKGNLALGGQERHLKSAPPPASSRLPVGGKIDLGVRSLNTFVTMCEGQRIGIFSGSGVGKSVLMGMVARYTSAEINVIALVGERGREVKEFIEQQLGAEGMKKSVVVVATGDEPPLMRRQAAYMAMAVAEYFRDCGFKVMMMMDSVTRFALAQREIGLSAGEPPTTRGFTPSVFSELPRLLERAGPGTRKGSITGVFTVLVEGGDMDEPVADAVRGIVDGHVVLSRQLAERGFFPSVDVLRSVSRMLPNCNTAEQNRLVNKARELLAAYADMEELIRLGAYRKGSDAKVDMAIKLREPLENFLRQTPNEHTGLPECYSKLAQLLEPAFG